MTTPGQVSSTITIGDDFLVQGDTTSAGISGLRVQINITYPTDPDLSATLYYDMGTASEVEVPLFSGVGGGSNEKNFTNTVFDDNAGTPIQNGSAPFFAVFNPQLPLSAFAGVSAKREAGPWSSLTTRRPTAPESSRTGRSASRSRYLPAGWVSQEVMMSAKATVSLHSVKPMRNRPTRGRLSARRRSVPGRAPVG